MSNYTVADVCRNLMRPGNAELPAPVFNTPMEKREARKGVMFAVASMKDHMTDEGWQIALALKHAGYQLAGHGLDYGTDVHAVVKGLNPDIVVMQDKREWDFAPGNFRDPLAAFNNYTSLNGAGSFNLTILKDSHQGPAYHRHSAEEMGVHAWITYYHPKIVKHLAPYVREKHLIRTYHSIDKFQVPTLDLNRPNRCLLSGAISRAYPLRIRIRDWAPRLPGCEVLTHPGYHRNGTASNNYLNILGRYKVAICTASMYGYSLRKLIEATAAGCMVITDLPVDDVMPGIDGNLYRVPPDIGIGGMASLIERLYREWSPERQVAYCKEAMRFYDYRTQGLKLATDINLMMESYSR